METEEIIGSTSSTDLEEINVTWAATPKNRTTPSKILMFNRIPKCGSESMIEILQRLRLLHGLTFNIIRSKVNSRPYISDRDELSSISKHILSFGNTHTVFERHINFIDFERFSFMGNNSPPTYFNMIRDPINRTISEFYYLRRPERIARVIKQNQTRNSYIPRFRKSFGECILEGHEECDFAKPAFQSRRYNMLSFLCGHEDHCQVPNHRRAVLQAKRNIEEHYAVVGILELMLPTLYVLSEYLPFYFRYGLRLQKKLEIKSNQNEHPTEPQWVIDHLRNVLWGDYEVYNFAKQRLHLQVHHIGFRKTLPKTQRV